MELKLVKVSQIAARLDGRGYRLESLIKGSLIDPIQNIIILCNGGHKIESMAYKAGEVCGLCNMLTQLRRADPAITCDCTLYNISQHTFEFRCGLGHRFMCGSLIAAAKGCPACVALSLARDRLGPETQLDPQCFIINEHTRVRLHCNNIRHNPQCKNPECAAEGSMQKYDPECKNFVKCDQDFYATPQMLAKTNSIYLCDHDHTWQNYGEIIGTIRLFEIYFDRRFDDVIIHKKTVLSVTGYNKELRLAFTHMNDSRATKTIASTIKYCEEAEIHFIQIPANLVKSSNIASFVFGELCNLGICSESAGVIIRHVRTKMRQMNEEHRLFANRITASS